MARSNRDEEGRAHHATQKRNADDDKFPTGQILTLAICKFSEPIAFNSVIAYTYIMVQWLQNGDETNASFWAGVLVSAYALGEVFTAVLWSYIADKIGRKPVVLIGLVGVGISSVMFGLAKSYWVALVARLLGGMLNGNVAVMQTMLTEIVTNPKHEPTAYAIHPFVWFAGGILGSAMGGYLAKPAHYYPGIFSPDGIFAEYPFLLPNIVCVVAIILAVVQGMIFLKETNPHAAERQKKKAKAKAKADKAKKKNTETTPLLASGYKSPQSAISEMEGSDSESSSATSPTLHHIGEGGLPSATDPVFDLRRQSFGTMHSIAIQPPPHFDLEETTSISKKPEMRETFNYTVMMLIGSLILVSYHSMGYFNMLPIYLLDEPHTPDNGSLDLKGGLGYDVHAVGTFMAVNGLISVFVQGVIFPIVVSKLGVWKSFVIMTAVYPLTYPFMPFLTMLPFGPWRSAGVYAMMIVQNHLNIIIPPCALILIKNAVPSPLVLGAVNGACMSLLSAARTAAPPLEGIIYSKGGSAAAWLSLVGFTVVAAIQLYWIPREPPPSIIVDPPSAVWKGRGHEDDDGGSVAVVDD